MSCKCVRFRDIHTYFTPFLTTFVDPTTLSNGYNLALTWYETIGCGENTFLVSPFIFNEKMF